MVSLLVTVVGGLTLLVSIELPHWTRGDIGLVASAPGLLTVDPVARGEVTLGNGYTVAMQPSGLRIARGDGVMVDTVTRGGFLSAVTGSVTGHREDVTADLSNIQITSLEIRDGHALWHGTAYGDGSTPQQGRPLLVDGTLTDHTVRVTFTVKGVDGIVLHLDARPATIGRPPALPARNLRLKGWWVTGQSIPLYDNVLRIVVGLEPASVPRALDLRPDGVLDLHVWADQAVLTVTTDPDFVMGDS
ncbi:MAG: hypothetical protein ABI131_11555 [Nostocoides sp.]